MRNAEFGEESTQQFDGGEDRLEEKGGGRLVSNGTQNFKKKRRLSHPGHGSQRHEPQAGVYSVEQGSQSLAMGRGCIEIAGIRSNSERRLFETVMRPKHSFRITTTYAAPGTI